MRPLKMVSLLVIAALSSSFTTCTAATQTARSNAGSGPAGPAEPPPTVAILIFNRVQIIDYSGPFEVFGESGFKIFTVAETTEPVTTVFGQKVTPEYSFQNNPKADIMVIPGGGVAPQVDNPKVIKWIQDNSKDAKYVLSVCNGSFILAQTGLLDGLTATTTNFNIPRMAKAYPKVKVVDDQRFVDNGKYITAAGLSSGIDGALHVVSKIVSPGRAQATALSMEYLWDPDGAFVRGALADKYIPRLNNVDIDGDIYSTQGDRNQWESTWIITRPTSAPEILDRISKELINSTTARENVKWMEQGGSSTNQRLWKFTDEHGSTWNASTVVEPSHDAKSSILRVKVTRDAKTHAAK